MSINQAIRVLAAFIPVSPRATTESHNQPSISPCVVKTIRRQKTSRRLYLLHITPGAEHLIKGAFSAVLLVRPPGNSACPSDDAASEGRDTAGPRATRSIKRHSLCTDNMPAKVGKTYMTAKVTLLRPPTSLFFPCCYSEALAPPDPPRIPVERPFLIRYAGALPLACPSPADTSTWQITGATCKPVQVSLSPIGT